MLLGAAERRGFTPPFRRVALNIISNLLKNSKTHKKPVFACGCEVALRKLRFPAAGFSASSNCSSHLSTREKKLAACFLFQERRVGPHRFYPHSPTPRWPSWGRAWIAPFAPPPSISGCGGWIGSLKKTLAAAEQERPDDAEKRARSHEELSAEPTAHLLFVDESGANTKMARLRGRALGGQRLLARIPHGHYQTSALISGIRLEYFVA